MLDDCFLAGGCVLCGCSPLSFVVILLHWVSELLPGAATQTLTPSKPRYHQSYAKHSRSPRYPMTSQKSSRDISSRSCRILILPSTFTCLNVVLDTPPDVPPQLKTKFRSASSPVVIVLDVLNVLTTFCIGVQLIKAPSVSSFMARHHL